MRLTKDEVDRLLNERFKDERYKRLNDLPDPMLFLDMQKAVDRIIRAIESNEPITVIGDYDVDGVVATAILVEFLESLGANFEYIIPNRFQDGYGVSPNVLNRTKGTLIITVDNGISAVEAAKACLKNGIDLIITDHHTPQDELPSAYAIVNPKQKLCAFPIKDICGAQVAWYLCAAIKSVLKCEYNLKNSLDILSIAIIADVMPLLDINRSLVRHGLLSIETSNRPAMALIRSMLNRDHFLSEDIAFLLAPKLNSAGRMDSAEIALKFLLSRDEGSARGYFQKLEMLNESRKVEENMIFEEALKNVNDGDSVILLWDKSWHEGVVGIVSARLCERFKKPAIVFSIKGDVAKGSGRSPENMDIFKLISTQKELLCGFGGHKCAAGLTVKLENIQKLKEALNGVDSESVYVDDTHHESLLGEISLGDVDMGLLEILGRYEPYGEGNPKPLFASEELEVKECRLVGEGIKHTYLVLKELRTDTIKKAIAYRRSYELRERQMIKCDFLVSKNVYNNTVEPKVIIQSVKVS